MSVLEPPDPVAEHVVVVNNKTVSCTCSWEREAVSETQAESIRDRHEWLFAGKPVK